MTKPRILIVENSIAITGALKSIIRSSQHLSDDYTFIFLLPKSSTAIDEVRSLGFEVYPFRMIELRKDLFSLIAYLPVLLYNSIALKKFVRRNNISLIVSNDFYNLIPAMYKMLGGSVPYICYVRFLPSRFPKPLLRFWCAWHQRYASTTIAVSKAVERELPYHDQVVVIGNELPSEDIHFIQSENSTTILYPANYIRGKGQEMALKSFAVIASKHPQWKLRFIGGDMGRLKNKEFKAQLMDLCHSLGLDSQTDWCDFSSNISEEYLAASIVLNFSESESFSLTCLEGLFHGRPVVATRSGGPSEIIDHGDTGILVDLHDVKAMADAMEYLINNQAHRHLMARRAYEVIRQRFPPIHTTEKLGAVYRGNIPRKLH